QTTKAEPSTLHWNVAPGSSEVNPNSPVGSLVGFGSLVGMNVSGAPASMIQVALAGVGSTLPDRSTARTSNVWEPSFRDGVVNAAGQVGNAQPSRLHWNVASGSCDANAKSPVGSVVGLGSKKGMVVSGADESTTQV